MRKTFNHTTGTSMALALLVTLVATLLAPLATAATASGGAHGTVSSGIQAFGSDTVAGYEARLSTSATVPGANVVFTVTKPSGETLLLPAVANSQGVATISLYDYHTRKAGVYSVKVALAENLTGNLAGSPKGSTGSAHTGSSFLVYPDEVSSEDSHVVTNKTLVRSDGKDYATITVQLKDRYGNAFQGHAVNLISSRSEDSLMAEGSSITNSTGSAMFTVSSAQGGVSVFSALDATSGKVLDSRVQVAFLKDITGLSGNASADMSAGAAYGAGLPDAGGDLVSFLPHVPRAFAQAATAVDHFELSGIPATVEANQNISFRITAQTEDDVTVENYTGTVHFSAEGVNSENVTLPEDFTFKAENLGTHQFSLGLRFPTSGTYTIVATDTLNQTLVGEVEVQVGAGSNQPGEPTGSGAKPVITSPQSGVSSQNIQTISGSASEGSDLTIRDNDREIGVAQVNADGTFSFTTQALSDGEHVFQVEAVAATGEVIGVSFPLTLTVDTAAPLLEDIQMTPSAGILPGDTVEVEVFTNEEVYESAIIFNDDIFELTADTQQDNVYTATVAAPLEDGDYTLDVLLVDELGNEETYNGAATLTVAADGSGSATGNKGPVPSQVFGTVAYGSNDRVTLLWEAATDDTQVAHYRIRYGLDPAALDKEVDTQDASTTWYVPGLENGQEYFFMVYAVDEDGNESLTGSELISAIPFSLEVESQLTERPDGVLSTAGEGAVLHGAYPGSLSEQGPELLWLLGGSGVAGASWRRFRKALRGKRRS